MDAPDRTAWSSAQAARARPASSSRTHSNKHAWRRDHYSKYSSRNYLMSNDESVYVSTLFSLVVKEVELDSATKLKVTYAINTRWDWNIVVNQSLLITW